MAHNLFAFRYVLRVLLRAIQFVGFAGLLLFSTYAYGGQGPQTLPSLKHSDIVFFGPAEPDVYKTYGATFIGWGGHPRSLAAIDSFRQRINDAHSAGMGYSTSIGMVTEFQGFIDFTPYFLDAVCTDLRGNRITAPWLWDRTYKGHPAYRNLDIHPIYKAYIERNVRWAVKGNPDAFHLDDPFGSSGLVCFNKQYMAGFRAFLKQYVPMDTLRAYGISDLENFDYGDYLRGIESRAIAESLSTKDSNLGIADYDSVRMNSKLYPLWDYYYLYTMRCSIENMKWVKEVIKEELARYIPISGNACYTSWKRLVFTSMWDYLTCEIRLNIPGRMTGEPLLNYKMGEALRTPMAVFGFGEENAYLKANNATGLAQGWIAEAYAFGQRFLVPNRFWCFTKELGSHYYYGKAEDYAPMYQFISRNAKLFDDYESLQDIGLLLNFANYRRNQTELIDCTYSLANLNVPFGMVIAGEDLWLDYIRLNPEILSQFSTLIIPENLIMDAQQKKALDDWGVKNKIIRWKGEKDFLSQYNSPIKIKGAENVWVLPRVIPNNAKAPVVCHLLNRNYVPANDTYTPCKNIKIEMANSLFKNRKFSKATMYTYDRSGISLKLQISKKETNIVIPELNIWALVVLE